MSSMINLFPASISKHMNLKKLKKYLLDKYDLELLVLFGSYAKNKLWKGSDLDIGFLTTKRMKDYELGNFMLDIIRLSGFDKINAIDLYFDKEERVKRLKGAVDIAGDIKELSLLQYTIYNTGQLLHEKEPGLFQNKRAEAIANAKYCGKDIKKMIIQDKLEFIKKLLDEIDEMENYRKTKNYSTVKNAEDIEELRKFYSYLYTAVIKTALDIVLSAVKLNRFILNEYCNFHPVNYYESFIKLEIIDGLPSEDIEQLKIIANTVGLYSFLTIDYFYGSGSTTHSAVENVRKLFPGYIKIIEKLFVIKPENKLERQIMADDEWIEGIKWGMPREGHPEGSVIHHVQEVLDNIDRLSVSIEDKKKLRIIALIHDSFKHKVNFNIPKIGDNNHAVLARKFAEKYTEDSTILKIIEHHDRAFNIWQRWKNNMQGGKAEKDLEKLLSILGSDLRLYHLFYKCDNETSGKNQEPFVWFRERVSKRWGE